MTNLEAVVAVRHEADAARAGGLGRWSRPEAERVQPARGALHDPRGRVEVQSQLWDRTGHDTCRGKTRDPVGTRDPQMWDLPIASATPIGVASFAPARLSLLIGHSQSRDVPTCFPRSRRQTAGTSS